MSAADVLDLQAAVVNLSLSSDRTSPSVDWDQENRDPVSLERPGSFQSWLNHVNNDDREVDAGPASPQRPALSSAPSLLNTPPRRQYDVSPFRTPGSDVSSFDRFHGVLPPRSAGTRASPAPSSGKYVPPRLRKQQCTAPSPESVSSRFTPPVSPLTGPSSPLDSSPPSAFSLRSPCLPPTGRNDPRLGDRYTTPRKGFSPFQTSQADNLLNSEPSTPASVSSCYKESVTPSSDRGYSYHRGGSGTVTPNTRTPTAASKSHKSAPTTPEAALLHYNPDLSRTAVKRIIHDAKNPSMTFNQKKHRSPSHLRRSERRQQERAAKEGSYGTPTVDKENLPENYADPWEENTKSVSSKAPPAPKVLQKEVVKPSLVLTFEPSTTKAKTMR